MMAKKINPQIKPEIPYPGKRPEIIPSADPGDPQVPEEDPDIIIDPDEPEIIPPIEPPPPGEGP